MKRGIEPRLCHVRVHSHADQLSTMDWKLLNEDPTTSDTLNFPVSVRDTPTTAVLNLLAPLSRSRLFRPLLP
jgi:hypothetical protein